MTKEQDNYSAFAGLNLSNARSESETYEQYKGRLRQNKSILKTYEQLGRDVFREMFPNGVAEALRNSEVEENKKELGEVK
tara:strand:- start:358 stop:597 length:240 start_codon:yes stop_codon:yes gene_type:complete